MDNTCITTGFAWKPEEHKDTKCVQLLIKKAADIYQDDFSLVHDLEVAKLKNKFSIYNLEQWNPDGGIFCACPCLEPGVYQFVFRVDNGGGEREFKISPYYDRTFLANGRAVNYIELTRHSRVDQSTTGRAKSKNERKFTQSTESQGDSSFIMSSSSERNFGLVNSDSQYNSEYKPCTLL